MGGNAFPHLDVVRLSPLQYIKFKAAGETLLRKYFKNVVVPKEAPEKADHGDIDFLVNGQLNADFRIHMLKVDFKAWEKTSGGSTTSFAIPLPDCNERKFFQVDVHVCKQRCFGWEVVFQSYGDLWHIIGIMVARVGLSISNTGLHVRVPVIDEVAPKRSLVQLTSDPGEIMGFLGLDAGRYEDGFETLDAAFDWVSSSRFFRGRFFKDQKAVDEKERKIRAQRVMYGRFVSEWLPWKMLLSLEMMEPNDQIDRIAVFEEALDTYDRRQECAKMLRYHREKMIYDSMWAKIKAALPVTDKELGKAMVALKCLMRWTDGGPCLCAKSDAPLMPMPLLDEETVDGTLLPWVLEHWQEAVRMNERP